MNLKAAEVLVRTNQPELVAMPLSNAGGEFSELADGLRFDLGIGSVNPEQYLKESKMTPLWYYRACLAAEGDRKAELVNAFREKFPESALLDQIEGGMVNEKSF